MGTYAVYTEINCYQNSEKVVKRILVTNVKSTSAGGAEHVILDIHETIKNALAFDMENPVDLIQYMQNSAVYDINDFKKRYAALIEHRHEVINMHLDTITEYNTEIAEKNAEIKRLSDEIRILRMDIENIEENIKFEEESLETYCKITGMRDQRTEEVVLGLA
jgi:uncharacterized coiled-coil protein SlyX